MLEGAGSGALFAAMCRFVKIGPPNWDASEEGWGSVAGALLVKLKAKPSEGVPLEFWFVATVVLTGVVTGGSTISVLPLPSSSMVKNTNKKQPEKFRFSSTLPFASYRVS